MIYDFVCVRVRVCVRRGDSRECGGPKQLRGPRQLPGMLNGMQRLCACVCARVCVSSVKIYSNESPPRSTRAFWRLLCPFGCFTYFHFNNGRDCLSEFPLVERVRLLPPLQPRRIRPSGAQNMDLLKSPIKASRSELHVEPELDIEWSRSNAYFRCLSF